jgi:hypothetical protein
MEESGVGSRKGRARAFFSVCGCFDSPASHATKTSNRPTVDSTLNLLPPISISLL